MVGPEDIHIHLHFCEGESGSSLTERVTALEAAMADQVTELTALRDQVTEFVEDLDSRIDALEAAQGQFTPEAQALLDSLKAGIKSAVDRVGDADTDGNPAPILPPPGEEPPTP